MITKCCCINGVYPFPHRYIQFTATSLIFHPKKDPINHLVITLDKRNRYLIQFYEPFLGLLYERDNCPKKNFCFVPKFVNQMNDNFLAKIDGILYFDFGKPNTGHLLFLNIDSKPMFCIVLEGEDLFPNVTKSFD